ncbi:two-component sensor histidine kinase [Nonomuraea sp. KC401]|uniref:histidine kinase n=1 Tax=Nonomuraea longispora TaxID=1848320 RepID=A0A4R4NA76_9ACTN|nr:MULTISPECIES: ATP-binding protein [Nonomuraea]NBE95550.1 two-component sensor histidine kinase [Nonomuraea sp. K271]TDC05921.1 two-component sensor histidine kinase [Nonomuraea longispora]TLF70823.1 two-component sensor histidine kinase [Nonomuraea sp. KC401]
MTDTTPSSSDARRVQAFLVVVMAAFALLDLALYRSVQRTSGPFGPAAGLALSLAADACLPFLVRFTRVVAMLVCAGSALAAVGDTLAPGSFTPLDPVTPTTVPLCTPAIVWFVVNRLPRREAVAYVAVLALAATRLWRPEWEIAYGGIVATVLPGALGVYARARRELLRSLRERAESTERERRLLAERAKAAERQRVAGEMHDIVTHHVTEIVLAAGALKVSAADHEVRAAAEHIRDAGSRTLTELRDLIGVLRRGHAHEPCQPARVTLDPSGLGVLVGSATSAGNPATLRVTGTPEAVTPAIARGAYRVVQEALTNARKHAPGAPVEVELAHDRDRLTVTVANAPPPAGSAASSAAVSVAAGSGLAASGSGLGLDGLRRRVSLLGGRFAAAPEADGGFRVSATLPVSVPTDDRLDTP